MEHAMVHAAITDRSPHSPPYLRHRPERTLLYQIIERYYPEFRDVMAMQGKGKPLPLHVEQEFDDFLNAVVWSMDSCGCNAPTVIMNT
jgi:hypothetical protein